MTARRASLVCVILALTATTTSAHMPAGLANPGFEENGLIDWHIQPQSQARGYQARVTDHAPHSGQRCLEIRHPNPQGFGLYGRVTQTISAEPYRGSRIRFRAALRPEVQYARSYAALYTRVSFGLASPRATGATWPAAAYAPASMRTARGALRSGKTRASSWTSPRTRRNLKSASCSTRPARPVSTMRQSRSSAEPAKVKRLDK